MRRPPAPDLRLAAVGVFAWLGSLSGGAAANEPGWRLGCGAVAAAVGALVLLGGPRGARLLATGALVASFAATATSATLTRLHTRDNPLSELAAQHAAVGVTFVVTSDPRLRRGRFEDYVVARGQVVGVHRHGVGVLLRAPVLVLAPPTWARVALGARVEADVRLVPDPEGQVSAVLRVRGDPVVRAPPAWWWRASAVLRAGLRDSVSGLGPDRRALVPALVLGDDVGLAPTLAADFRTTGLTHLLAVSGTNLTLLVGFLVVVARAGWERESGALRVVGVVGVCSFVLLARPEPSVLRAAVMGSVALVGMGSPSRSRGPAVLGFAVTALLLVAPDLARQPGFALSVWRQPGSSWLRRRCATRWRPGAASRGGKPWPCPRSPSWRACRSSPRSPAS
ncbi:MAG: ComEC/Rec2 family competence protein [Nocardioides sp.]